MKNIWITIPTILLCLEPTISVTGGEQTQTIRGDLSQLQNKQTRHLLKICRHYWTTPEPKDVGASICAELLKMTVWVPNVCFSQFFLP